MPGPLRFSGARAFEWESDFVARFPGRHSGQPNNRLAAQWVLEAFTRSGWTCRLQEWEVINYSRPVPLQNVVCKLPGRSDREILVVAHHDQAPTTIEGADNDGSGVAILLHLGELLPAGAPHPYTLTFVSTDAEEYGMLGARHYIQTHPDTASILAGISLDNLGRSYCDGLGIELLGQFRRYGPIWLPLVAREAARAASWELHLRSPLEQVIDQAAPISFMDQGPMVAVGVPALGFSGHFPPDAADENYRLWHDPDDRMKLQSPEVLGKAGLTTEALIRTLLAMKAFPPRDSGPYLYFEGSRPRRMLRGLPLWSIFTGFVALFFLGSALASRGSWDRRLHGWMAALPHFLGWWLPLLAAVVLLYGLVAAGLMDEYHLYPATAKDPALFHPRWPAVGLFIAGLAIFCYLGRVIAHRLAGRSLPPERAQVKSLSLLVVGLAGVYVLSINPFSLLFFVPLLLWLLIRGRQGMGRALDSLLFLSGGLALYALIYFFGFAVLRYDFLFFWFLMNMISIQMVGPATMVAITAIIGAGLSMVTDPPGQPAIRS